MRITINPELEPFVDQKVRQGEFDTPDAVVTAALSFFKDQEQSAPPTDSDHESYLREELEKGIQAADRGEFTAFDAEQIIAERHRHLLASRKAS